MLVMVESDTTRDFSLSNIRLQLLREEERVNGNKKTKFIINRYSLYIK